MPFPTYDDYEELQKRGATPPFLPVAQAAPPPAPLAQPGPAPAAGLAPPPLSQPPEAPEPLDTPGQPGPITQRAMQLAQRGAPQLPNRGTAGLIADTAASIFLGPRKAQAILHPKYTQQMADYQRQLGGLAMAAKLEEDARKNSADIEQSRSAAAASRARQRKYDADIKKPQTALVSEGQDLVNSVTGKPLYQNKRTPKPTVVSPGSVVLDADGKPIYTAPAAPKEKSVATQRMDIAARTVAEQRNIKLDFTRPLIEQLPTAAQAEAVKLEATLRSVPDPLLQQLHRIQIAKGTEELKDLKERNSEETIANEALGVAAGKITMPPSESRRAKIINYIAKNNVQYDAPLSPAAQRILQETDPTLQAVDRALSELESRKNDNTPFAMAVQRGAYSLGMATKYSQLINQLELNRVIGAARVLKGSSRAYQALQLAMVHTPNTKTDSPKLMYEKLQNIRQNLADTKADALRYGNKYGVVQRNAQAEPDGSATKTVTMIAPDGTQHAVYANRVEDAKKKNWKLAGGQ